MIFPPFFSVDFFGLYISSLQYCSFVCIMCTMTAPLPQAEAQFPVQVRRHSSQGHLLLSSQCGMYRRTEVTRKSVTILTFKNGDIRQSGCAAHFLAIAQAVLLQSTFSSRDEATAAFESAARMKPTNTKLKVGQPCPMP